MVNHGCGRYRMFLLCVFIKGLLERFHPHLWPKESNISSCAVAKSILEAKNLCY
jgi:hypothetical protein